MKKAILPSPLSEYLNIVMALPLQWIRSPAMLRFSSEQTAYIIRNLEENGILKKVEGAFEGRWTVDDFLKLEDLPKDISEPTQLDSALHKISG